MIATMMSPTQIRRIRCLVDQYYDIMDVRTRTNNRVERAGDEAGIIAVLEEEVVGDLKRSKDKKLYQKELKKVRKEAEIAGMTALHGKKDVKLMLEKNKESSGYWGKEVKKAYKHEVFYEAHDFLRARVEFMGTMELLDDEETDPDAIVPPDKLKKWANMATVFHLTETFLKNKVQREIDYNPVWSEWLKNVKGVGPCITGGLLAHTDVRRAPHVSGFLKYCGMGVTVKGYMCEYCQEPYEIGDPRMQSRIETLSTDYELEVMYCPECNNRLKRLGRADRRTAGEQTGYKPWMKTHAFKIGESFVKISKKGFYGRFFKEYRTRIEDKPCNEVHYEIKKDKDGNPKKDKKGNDIKKVIPCPKAHKYAKARRATAKLFLSHYYMVHRAILGLPISAPFSFGILGHDKSRFIEPQVDDGEISFEIRNKWQHLVK